MTGGVATGLALALAASVALNTAFLLQHSAVAEADSVDALKPIATIGGLLRRRVWLAGLALGTAGWAMHVAALAHAPLSLVQAFVAGGLALLAPIAVRWFGQPLSAAEGAAVVVMAGGLALLALGVHEPRHPGAPGAALGVFLGGCAAGAGLLALQRGGTRLALAAGLLYGAADTAIKAVSLIAARHGLAHALVSPWTAGAGLATLAAFFAFQRALQLGPPVTAIALMTGGTYAVSILAGLAVLGEPLGTGTVAVVHALAFAAVVGSALVLSPLLAARRPA